VNKRNKDVRGCKIDAGTSYHGEPKKKFANKDYQETQIRRKADAGEREWINGEVEK